MARVRRGPATADVREGCCAFARKFYRVIARKKEGNIVASPFIMHLMLTYLFHGSDGLSAKEIVAALCFFTVDGLREQYKNMINAIKDLKYRMIGYQMVNSIHEEITLKVNFRSVLFYQKNLRLELPFVLTGKKFYKFDFETVDFEDKYHAAKLINLWFSEKTENKIEDVFSPEDISNRTKVMMVSVIHLKVKWQLPFYVHLTQQKEFCITANLKKQVLMMRQNNLFQYGKLPSMKSSFILLPFEEGLLDMFVILPDEIEGLKFLEEHFDWNNIAETQSSWEFTKLCMPRFKIETTVDLKSIRREMGLESIFEERGDFDRIAPTLMGPRLKIDGIFQKVFLDVNEAGTDASLVILAKRRIDREKGQRLNVFVVDRPFMVVIRHIPSEVPLFVASVRDIGEEIPKVKSEADKTPIVRRCSSRLQAKREKESIKQNGMKRNKQPKGPKQQKKQKQS